MLPCEACIDIAALAMQAMVADSGSAAVDAAASHGLLAVPET